MKVRGTALGVTLLMAVCCPGAGAAADCTVSVANRAGGWQLILVDGAPQWLDQEGVAARTGCRPVPVRTTERSELPYTLAALRVEDFHLRRGVTLSLPRGGDREPFLLTLPRKNVFLPFPYFVPFSQGGAHPETWAPAPMLVQVRPRITKKADVQVRNTSEFGLVAKVVYKGAGFFEVKDALQRVNRRDLSFGLEKKLLGTETTFQVENVFETYLERRMSILNRRELGAGLTLQTRMDNLLGKAPFKFGANTILREGPVTVEVGNVGLRQVEKQTHAQATLEAGGGLWTFRSEDVALGGNDQFPFVARDQKNGGMVRWQGGNGLVSLAVGNLNLEDVDEEGTVDSQVHQRFTLNYEFGGAPFYRSQAWHVSGTLRPGMGGVGNQRWGRNHMDLDITYRRKYVLRMRYDDDYLRFQGPLRREYWQTIGFSMNVFRDIFSPDRLTRLGLDAVYADYEITRRRKGEDLEGEWRVGAARLFHWKNYDIPLEFGLKYSDERFVPDLRFSIREYL